MEVQLILWKKRSHDPSTEAKLIEFPPSTIFACANPFAVFSLSSLQLRLC